MEEDSTQKRKLKGDRHHKALEEEEEEEDDDDYNGEVKTKHSTW